MANGTGSDVWKQIALVLIGLVLGLGGTMVTQLRGSVTRAEVEAIVNTSGPYIQDRAAIATKLEIINAQQQSQSQKIDAMQDQVTRIAVAVGVSDSRRRGQQ